MKKIATAILLTGLVLVSPQVVHAQTEDLTTTTAEEENETQLASPGITPDSPFYFMDKLSKQFSLAFTFSKEAKAKKMAAIAEERLAEAQVMAEKGKDDLAEKTTQEYGKNISEAAELLSQVAKEGGDIEEQLTNLIERSTTVHSKVLNDVYEKVPAQAKQSIEQAMEESSRGQSKALDALSEEKRQEIMEKRPDSEELRQLPEQVPEGIGPGRKEEQEDSEEDADTSIPSIPGREDGQDIPVRPDTSEGEQEQGAQGQDSPTDTESSKPVEVETEQPQEVEEVIPGR